MTVLRANPPRPWDPVGAVWHRCTRKTRCPAGHPYDKANTARYRGKRQCRACSREEHRRRYWAKKTSEGAR